MELVRFCKHMYKEGMKLCKGIPDADAKPADFFAVLAAHLLMEVYVDTSEGHTHTHTQTHTCTHTRIHVHVYTVPAMMATWPTCTCTQVSYMYIT